MKYKTHRKLFLTVIVLFAAQVSGVYAQMSTSTDFPLQFTENQGQWKEQVLYAALHGDKALCFTREGPVFLSCKEPSGIGIPTETMFASLYNTQKYKFVNPSSAIEILGSDTTETLSHFYYGNDSSNWREDVVNVRSVLYKHVWKNIDVRYTAQNKRIRQTFIVHPGANTGDIALRAISESKKPKPPSIISVRQADETHSGEAKAVFREKTPGVYTMSVTGFNQRKSLILETEFATYFGGSSSDVIGAICVDREGNIYGSGQTRSYDLPVLNAFQDRNAGDLDNFVCKFACDGKTLLFSTYIGGKDDDSGGWGLLIGKYGNVYFYSSWSLSVDYPITPNALVKSSDGHKHGLVGLSSDGKLVYSSFLINDRSSPRTSVI